MKNVTISLQEEVARWVRVEAAEHEMSVSRFIAELLRERMTADESYRRAMRRYLSRAPVELSNGPYPSREELHERGTTPYPSREELHERGTNGQ